MYRLGVKWVRQRRTWECKDGFVCFIIMAGQTGAPGNTALTEWMDREGLAPECMKQMDWTAFNVAAEDIPAETIEQITNSLADFFKRHTKAELYEEAVKKRIPLYPCSTVEDLRNDPHLAARDFWTELKHTELNDTLVYPRPCMLASETPCTIRRRAPLIGEHNEEVYMGELGFTREELILFKQGGVI